MVLVAALRGLIWVYRSLIMCKILIKLVNQFDDHTSVCRLEASLTFEHSDLLAVRGIEAGFQWQNRRGMNM